MGRREGKKFDGPNPHSRGSGGGGGVRERDRCLRSEGGRGSESGASMKLNLICSRSQLNRWDDSRYIDLSISLSLSLWCRQSSTGWDEFLFRKRLADGLRLPLNYYFFSFLVENATSFDSR